MKRSKRIGEAALTSVPGREAADAAERRGTEPQPDSGVLLEGHHGASVMVDEAGIEAGAGVGGKCKSKDEDGRQWRAAGAEVSATAWPTPHAGSRARRVSPPREAVPAASGLSPPASGHDAAGVAPSGRRPRPRTAWLRALLPHLGFVIVYALWGINLSSMKLGGQEWDPLVFNGLRFASMIPLLGAYTVIYCREPLRTLLRSPRDLLLIAGLGVLNAVGMEALLQYALQYSNAANGAVLGRGMMPVVTVLLALVAGQTRVTWRLAAGIPLALAGVLVIVSGGAEGFQLGADTIRGDVLLLARSVMGALYLIGMSRLVKRHPVTVLLTAEMTAGAAALLPFVFKHADAAYFAAISRTGWVSLLYTAVLATGLGFWLHNVCLARLGPIKASAYGYLLPVTAAAAGLVLMGETLSAYQCAGAAGVLGAMYLVQRDRRAGAGTPLLPAKGQLPRGQAAGRKADHQI